MDLITLIVLGLATWRLTSLVSQEDGPRDILAKFRHFVGVRYDENSQPYGTNNFSKGLLCMHCASLWVGVVLVIAWLVFPIGTLLVAFALSLSALAIIVDTIMVK